MTQRQFLFAILWAWPWLVLGSPPTISDIPDQAVAANSATPALLFTISDAETPASSLSLLASSTNSVLVPVSRISFTGSGGSRFVRVTPTVNQAGTTLITVTVRDGANETAADSFLLTVTNGAPVISAPGNRAINAGVTSAPIPFIVFDRETSPSNLVVHGVSSDTNLIPNEAILLGGFGSNRTLTFVPAMQLGTSTVTLTAIDVFGATTSDSFEVVVSNSPPWILASGTLNLLINSNGAKSFTVGDLESPPASLNVNVFSSNPVLVPDANISISASGSNRTVTIIPASNQVGAAQISIVVTDLFNATRTNAFTVDVSQFGEITNSLPGFGYPSLALGDYDGDGRMDFAVIAYPATSAIYRNAGDGTFTNIGANLLGVQYGAVAWVDFDGDGDLDLTLSGRTAGGTDASVLYRNNGAGNFAAVPATLPPMAYTGLAWGDYDNDGDPDLLLSGDFTNAPLTKLFRNDAGVLVDSGVQFSPVSSAAGAWGDYDNDGDLDLLLSGRNAGYSPQGRIYRNAGNGTFINIDAPLAGLMVGSAAWGDDNGDGHLDVLLHGADSSSSGITRVYRGRGDGQFSLADLGPIGTRLGAGWGDYDNDGDLDLALGYRQEGFAPHFYRNDAGAYVNSGNNINGLGLGALAWGDYDNDGRLDLLQTGENYSSTARYTRLFRNYGPVTNMPPSTPGGMTALVSGRTVRLSWSPAADGNQTAPLTYNLRVGTAPLLGNVMSSQSLPNGRRLLPAFGNAWMNTNWWLRTLAPGTYYASVQAVDAGFLGSSFSSEISFVIASSPGQASASTEEALQVTFSDAIGNGLANANGLATTAWFEFGTTTAYGQQTTRLSIGSSMSDVSISRALTGLVATTTYHMRLVVANAAGTNYGNDRVFTTPAFSPFSELTLALPEAAMAGNWVDYDNDGDLDIVSGKLIRNDGGAFTNTGVTVGGGVWGDYDNDNWPDRLWSRSVERNNRNGTFTTVQLTLPSLPIPDYAVGASAWGDYDADGDSDLLITGQTIFSEYYATVLYRNDRNGQFTRVTSGLPHALNSAPAWFDYDSDGWLDVLLTNFRFTEQPSFLYRNNGGRSFSNSGAALQGARGTCSDWSDYDNDGDLDLLLGGLSANTRIFRNDGGLVETGVTNLPAASQVSWGDYDNDGDADLLLVTLDSAYYSSAVVYRNDGGGVFTESGVRINGASAAYWGDYDLDGDLDILASGTLQGAQPFARIYRNNNQRSNAPPAAPTGLGVAFAGRAIVLTWNPPTDANQTNGWNYNLRVGSTSGGTEIMSPLANITTGFRRIPRFGNAGVGTNWVLTNLSVGTYFWSVQAIDHAFAGSAFAPQSTFVVPPWPPDIVSAYATNPTLVSITLVGRVNPNNRASLAWFEFGLTSNYTHRSSSQSLGAVNSELTATIVITNLTPLTTYHYRMAASNDLGVTYGDDGIFATAQFTGIDAGFNMLSYQGGLWGDFDGDGWLDAAYQGTRSNYYHRSIFHNNGNGGFTELNTGLPSGGYSGLAVNVDRDGDLDLLLVPDGYQPIFLNNGAASFLNSTYSFGFSVEYVAPGDVDNDGDTDLFVGGYDGVNSRAVTKLFTNNGSGVFSESATNFITARYGFGTWADTDNDGDLDLAFSGTSYYASTNFSRLYRNDGPLGFTALSGVFRVVVNGSMAWCDYDNDGDLDLFLTGYTSTSNAAWIYRNDGGNSFTEIDAGILPVVSSSAQWGDYDNDGWADLLLSGAPTGSDSGVTLLYRNLGGSSFQLQPIGLPGVMGGNAAWGDHDLDGDLDILLAGRYIPASLYRNNALTPNAAPQPPTSLVGTVINGNSAQLSWQPGGDANQTGGHTFNLRVGTSSGAGNIVNALAVWPGGRRRVPEPGNVQQSTNWWLRGLTPGTYYWSVQAIDHSLAGSAFAAERTFVVLPFRQPPAITTLAATNIEFFTAQVRSTVNPNGVASTAWFEYGLTTNYGNATPAVPLGNGTNVVGFSQWLSNLTANTVYHFRGAAMNSNGVNYGLNQSFTTPAYALFSDAGAGIAGSQAGSLTWGDYDKDGDLDLLQSGASGIQALGRIYRNDGGVFTNPPAGILGTRYGTAQWGDYDNDGDLDVVIVGNTEFQGNSGRVYRNDGTQWTQIAIALPAVYQGTAAWADLDRDGDLDLVVASSSGSGTFRNDGNDRFTPAASFPTFSGPFLGIADLDNDGDNDVLLFGYENAGTRRLYMNDGSGNFTELATTLPGLADGAVSLSDYDNDGDLDLAVTGNRWSFPVSYFSGIFRNDGNGVFTDIQASLPQLNYSTCTWGDHDNDGAVDLFLAGRDNQGNSVAKLFRNNGAGVFSDAGANLPGAPESDAQWGDYDNDGDLDLALSAGAARLYRNNATNANAVPSAPGNLASLPSTNAVRLSWSAPFDANQSGGFTYNVRVGTTPGAANVLGPMANVTTGFRQIPHLGNAGARTWLLLTNLSAGTYYWSVQAIDHALAGSAFAAESMFTLAPRAPVAFTAVATNVTITTATLTGYVTPNGASSLGWFEYGLSTNYSDRTPMQSVGGGFGQVGHAITITNLFPGNIYHYRLVATNSLGIGYGADQTVLPPMFTEIAVPFVAVKSGSVMWGDYDADGDLDLALTGDSSSIVNSTITRIYRNNGAGGFTDIDAALAPALAPGQWGDYDNDGDLDLLVLPRVYRNDSGNFTGLSPALPSLSFPATAWGDYDNDGQLDILCAGHAGGSGPASKITQVFRNLGDGAFASIGASMQGVESASVAWGDYDNDGDLDVLRTGFNTGGVRDSRIYRSNGDGTFSSLGASLLPGVTHGSGVWGDYDNDGDLDVLLTGDSSTGRITKVFRNIGGDAFADAGIVLPGIALGTALWADYDNDGDLDILIAGQGAGLLTKLYRNNGNGTFSDSQIPLPGVFEAAAAWGDYDGDGDLDLVLAGYDESSTRITRLYRNNCRVSNALPSSPSGLSAVVSGRNVALQWAESSDANQAGGLSYNIRVGTVPGSGSIVSGMANPLTGRRYIAEAGNAQSRTRSNLKNLAPGAYYWSVQAIDHSMSGSAFASEKMFVITNHAPVAQPQLVVLGEDTTNAITLVANDADGDALVFRLLSSTTNGVLTGIPPNLVYRPASNFVGADSFNFEVRDALTSTVAGVSLVITQVWDVTNLVLGIQRASNGRPALNFFGEPFEGYAIEVSEDLVRWSVLTNVWSSNGFFAVMLADASVYARRFYRTKLAFPPAMVAAGSFNDREGFRLDFAGEVARTYAVQASTDLVNWVTLTNVLAVSSPMRVSDLSATNFQRRFYRLTRLR